MPQAACLVKYVSRIAKAATSVRTSKDQALLVGRDAEAWSVEAQRPESKSGFYPSLSAMEVSFELAVILSGYLPWILLLTLSMVSLDSTSSVIVFPVTAAECQYD